jgi:hypothetical protein
MGDFEKDPRKQNLLYVIFIKNWKQFLNKFIEMENENKHKTT